MNNMKMSHFHQARSIAFVHHKGGTGKTTSCLNIAGWLKKLHQKVLVLDLDPQGNASAGLGVDVKSLELSIADVLFSQADINEVILETSSGIYLAPANLDLLAAEVFLANQLTPALKLREKLNHLDHSFDFILIDAPPGSGLLMINSIVAAENIIVPMDTGVFGYETLDTLQALLSDIHANVGVEVKILMALLRNLSSSIFDRKYTNNIRNLVAEFFSENKLESCQICTVPFSKKIHQAQYAGLPISHYSPFAKVGRAYRRIAKQIIEGVA